MSRGAISRFVLFLAAIGFFDMAVQATTSSRAHRGEKSRHEPRRMADMKPAGTITCMRCDAEKTADGSRPFRAWMVCADCVKALQALETAGMARQKEAP